MRRISILLTLVLAVGAPVAVAGKGKHRDGDRGDRQRDKAPATIALPAGWQPEGIAAGPSHQIFMGSIPTGAIYAASTKTGKGATLVPAREGRAAIGIKYHRGTKRLYVAGGRTGSLFVYDARTGDDVAQFDVGGAFVNDVVLANGTAYFTDSFKPVFYRLPIGGGAPATVPVTGDLQYAPDHNANGLVAAKRDGALTLITVQMNLGKLFTLDPSTGVTKEIDLGGATLPGGDGLLLEGRTLYVVQNASNQIAVVRLAKDLTSARVVRKITNPAFAVPTTVARQGPDLFVVNAKFGTPPEGTPYEVVRVRTRGNKAKGKQHGRRGR